MSTTTMHAHLRAAGRWISLHVTPIWLLAGALGMVLASLLLFGLFFIHWPHEAVDVMRFALMVWAGGGVIGAVLAITCAGGGGDAS